ncbi:hypothetical protein EW146_g8090 [Bondarzewia mesenterica]|uniref:Cap64 protein n=1 Tax=Bondarzewia mesenterica TaxID=1095465 RepID=A0A4S4LHD2_9AGAM|nr:hypothetical protein EW146_g8090 [Bondarzewia mesenterica]
MMQRRAGKNLAHIAPPTPGLDTSMVSASNEKPLSRLNQRSFGVTNRIWLILSLFLFIVLFTRFILPSSTSDNYYYRHHSHSYSANLKPTNYLNASEEVGESPFEFCPTFGPGDELSEKYGALAVSKSWLHLGSGARVQKVIHKAMIGQPVTISIIGGSVSSCHGAGDDPIATDCYPSRFFNWWNSIFPHPASELTNGAMRRTNSEYFSFCNAHHLPDFTDLVIIELDTDDGADRSTLENFELLVRSILLRPDSPAIIILGHFSPQVHQQNGFAGPDHWHSVVSQFYDVPHISTKWALYPMYITSPSSINRYFTDPILANPTGHALIADILIAYVQSQICVTWSAATGRAYEGGGSTLPVYYALGGGDEQVKQPTDARGLFGGKGLRKGAVGEDLDADDEDSKQQANSLPAQLANQLKVPPSRIASLPEDLQSRAFEEIEPICVSANDLINPLPPSLFYGSGWHAYHPPSSSPYGIPIANVGAGPASSSAAHYWYSTLPTSRLRIPVTVGAGDVGIYYVREPRAVVGEGSDVECWVDDNYQGAKVIANVADIGESVPALEMIDRFVARGSHFVECLLMGDEGQGVSPFKIIGIFTT